MKPKDAAPARDADTRLRELLTRQGAMEGELFEMAGLIRYIAADLKVDETTEEGPAQKTGLFLIADRLADLARGKVTG